MVQVDQIMATAMGPTHFGEGINRYDGSRPGKKGYD